jgi:hypothetical protein
MQHLQAKVEALEKGIADGEAERDRLLDRRRQELDDLEGRLAEQRSKLSALVSALAPGETSEAREAKVTCS